MDIVVLGPQGGETKVVLADGSDLQKSFLNKTFVKSKLGPPARDLIQKTSAEIRKKQKELKDLQTSEQLSRNKDEEMQTLISNFLPVVLSFLFLLYYLSLGHL